MAITKDKKKDILKKLTEAAKAESVCFVNFHGLPVAETTEMRKKLREEGVSYYVARKTLMRKAFEEAGIDGELPTLDGEAGVAFSSDLTAPAREVYAFHKKFNGSVNILGGVFEGRFLNKIEMEEIATIPPTDVLRGMFVNIINSPIQRFAIALGAIAEKKEA